MLGLALLGALVAHGARSEFGARLVRTPVSVPASDEFVLPAQPSELIQRPGLADSLEARVVAVTVVGPRLSPRVLTGEELPPLSELPSARRYLVQLRVDSVDELHALLPSMGQDSSGLMLGPAVLPPDLGELPVGAMKETFLAAMAPAVLFESATVMAQRERLLRLLEAGAPPRPDDRFFLAEMAARYRLENEEIGLPTLEDSLRALLRRVDTVPASLALAQAAIESGWGTSRLSVRGNNLYGQQLWSRPGRDVFGRTPAPPAFTRMARYPTVAASVCSYMLNLNTHEAYADFRMRREHMRRRAQRLDAVDLAYELRAYSERGREYVHDLVDIMRDNGLERFDADPTSGTEPAPG